jgi:hypothetical protein
MKNIILIVLCFYCLLQSCSPITSIDGYSVNSVTVNIYNFVGQQQVTVNGITKTVNHECSWEFDDLSDDTITVQSSSGFSTYKNIPKSYILNVEITL